MARRAAFTLIELLVVIAIIAILAAILFPVFSRAKGAATEIRALSQAKQMGMAIMLYAQDHDDAFAPATNYGVPTSDPIRIWQPVTLPYVKSQDLYIAPGTSAKFPRNWSERGDVSIGYNGATAYDPAGCVEGQASTFGCEGFTSSTILGRMDEPAAVGLFATTPNGPISAKYRGYVFSPYNGTENPDDMRRSLPLVSDRDLVKELAPLFPPSQLKPIYARYGATGEEDGRTPVIFGDGHAKNLSAKRILSGSTGTSGLIWRFR